MIKKILKVLLFTILVLVIGFVSLVYIRKDRTFKAPYPAISASTDSAVIARGRAIVKGKPDGWRVGRSRTLSNAFDRAASFWEALCRGGSSAACPT